MAYAFSIKSRDNNNSGFKVSCIYAPNNNFFILISNWIIDFICLLCCLGKMTTNWKMFDFILQICMETFWGLSKHLWKELAVGKSTLEKVVLDKNWDLAWMLHQKMPTLLESRQPDVELFFNIISLTIFVRNIFI